jgi:hypothetical protein
VPIDVDAEVSLGFVRPLCSGLTHSLAPILCIRRNRGRQHRREAGVRQFPRPSRGGDLASKRSRSQGPPITLGNAMLDAMVRVGLATAERREMRAGRQPITVTWFAITDAGRQALVG